MLCQRTYVVLGMGRSSTSVVARSLAENFGNGSFGEIDQHGEDPEFVELNNLILSTAGGTWFKPPTEAAILEAGRDSAISDRIRQLIGIRNERFELWGWKDPRTTLTIRCYLPWLTNPHLIACWRNAHDVSLSLLRLNLLPSYQDGVLLARDYHNRLLRLLTEYYAS